MEEMARALPGEGQWAATPPHPGGHHPQAPDFLTWGSQWPHGKGVIG